MPKTIMLYALLLSLLVAHAQAADNDTDLSDLAEADWSKMKLTQAQAEEMAQLVYGEEIRTGKLTRKQAGAYLKCTEEDYAAVFVKSPEAKQLAKVLQHGPGSEGWKAMSASEQEKHMAEAKKFAEAAEKLKGKSREKCRKKLGMKRVPKEGMAGV